LPFDDPLIITVVAGTVVVACLIVLYAMRGRGKKTARLSVEEKSQASLRGLPFKVAKSVSSNDAGHAKDELRILDLEREILSDAIRKLYEASADGKISEEERERLGQTYKSRMMTVKDAISRDESVVALHELEVMQEDLIKLFSERFDELSGKIDELRQRTETKPIKEIALPTAKGQQEESAEEKAAGDEKAKRKRKPPSAKPSPRTEAEKRIEEIRSEVEKVLDRLGQMEIEG
jgi:hypothetical protein